MICVSVSARVLSMIPGYDLENITTLRSFDDAQFIATHAEGKNVVILGTSFIGLCPITLYEEFAILFITI